MLRTAERWIRVHEELSEGKIWEGFIQAMIHAFLYNKDSSSVQYYEVEVYTVWA